MEEEEELLAGTEHRERGGFHYYSAAPVSEPSGPSAARGLPEHVSDCGYFRVNILDISASYKPEPRAHDVCVVQRRQRLVVKLL